MLITLMQNKSFSCSTNLTASIDVSSHGVWTRWSAQNVDEYETRGEMAVLTVAGISTFLMFEDSRLHILKWSSDDTMQFRHNAEGWRSWRFRSGTPDSLSWACRKEGEKRKSSDDLWWKWRMGPGSMTDVRPLRANSSMSRLLTPITLISASSSSGCFANIIAPITDAIASISCFETFCNDVSTTVEYKEYESLNPSVLSSCFLVLSRWKRGTGFSRRNSATVIAQINTPAARGTKYLRAFVAHPGSTSMVLSRDLRNLRMSSEVLSSGLTLLPEGISIYMLVESGKDLVIRLSCRLVMTNLILQVVDLNPSLKRT